MVTLPATLVAGLAITRVLVDFRGPEAFAAYSVVATLPNLFPMADIGFGAALVDSVARAPAGSETLRITATVTTQAMAGIGFMAAVVAVLLGVFGKWSPILHLRGQTHIDLAASLAVGLFFGLLPLTLGYRVLQGLDRTHTIVWLQAASSIILAVALIATVVCGAPLWVLCAEPVIAVGVTQLIACSIGRRAVRIPLSELLHKVQAFWPHLKEAFAFAGPAALIVAALPVGLETDRIVLAHTAGLRAVAAYSAGSQLFLICYSFVVFGGQSLWPMFARGRYETSQVGRSQLAVAARVFALGSLALALGLVLAGPPVTSVTTDGRATAGYVVMGSFGLLLLGWGLYWPVGMFCTDVAGLRFQAVWACVMTAVNLPLSILLARMLGAPGPVLASAATVFALYFFPTGLRAWFGSREIPSLPQSTL